MNDSINWLFNFDVDILSYLHFFNFVLDNWNLHLNLNLSDRLFDNFFLNDFFDYLRYLYHFLDYSRNNYDLLNHFLNFDYFRNLYHLLNEFFHNNRYFLDSVYKSGHLYHFLLNVLDYFRNIHVNIYELLNLNNFRFFHHQRLFNNYLFDMH